MGEFASIGTKAMTEDNATKIEPTLKPIEDAPSIAAAPEAPAVAAKVETTTEPKTEAKIEPKAAEPAKAETSTVEPPKAEMPAREPPLMPRAAQISVEPIAAKKAPTWLRAGEEKPHAPAQSRSRFPLLAATVAIAASLGAVAGSFGSAMLARAPAEAVTATHIAKESTDEIRALKETVAQLRANTKTLSDNVAALKLSVSNANAQLTKIAETVDRRAAAPAAPETTGSIAKPVPVVLGAPPAPLQHPIVQGWTLRRVYDGAALIEGRDGIIEVEPGTSVSGLGRIEDIKKQDGRWVVLTSKGLIVSPGK
jgi:hypothetical protein